MPLPSSSWHAGFARVLQLLPLWTLAGVEQCVKPCELRAAQVGHVIRAVSRGYLPPTPFLLASLGATLVLLVGWRTALAAATPEVGDHAKGLTACAGAAKC